MHDLTFIREHPETFDSAMHARGVEPQADALLALDAARRERETRIQELQQRRNALAKDVGRAKKAGEDAEALMAEAREVNASIAALEAEREADSALSDRLAALPNLPAEDVPEGADEADNVEVRQWGEPRVFDNEPQPHETLGETLGGMDFEAAASISGARFVALSGALARLERALGQFMLDIQTQEHGFTEVSPPYLVRDAALFGTGQLPKFSDDLFHIPDTGHWLIPTAEVPLTNLAREQILDADALPQRMAALTPCFRAEAGAAGRDTRGMIRQHQFHKVEMVTVCRPDQAEAEHAHMLAAAETILQRLELPYRVMLLCAGDMGFSARRTWDIEVWMPSQARYREISSISWCGDFQARRMRARFRRKGEKPTHFAHTLNGSGLAVGRTLIAVMENYQQKDGSIAVPEALQGYMGGTSRIAALQPGYSHLI